MIESTTVTSPLPHQPVRLPAGTECIESIHVSKIKVVSNVRVSPLDKDSLASLAATIRLDGQLEPAQVRPLGDGSYALTLGHRRHAAVTLNHAKHGGDGMLRCIVRSDIEPDDIPFVQLVENLQREDMSEYDMAVTLADLKARRSMTTKQIGERIGRSPGQVQLYVTIGEAPDWLRAALRGVTVKVKAKDKDGSSKMNSDGTPVIKERTLPGLSLDKVSLLVGHYNKLHAKDQDHLKVPGYKPRAEKMVRSHIRHAAVHDLSKSELSARLKSSADGAESENDEVTVVRSPKPAYSITQRTIQIDLTKMTSMSAEQLSACAHDLYRALTFIHPGFFSAVDMKAK